jgi:hypothetical protein
MKKFSTYFALLVVLLYYALGVFVLVSNRIQFSPKIKIIFAIFLFLYGTWRLARIWTKHRENSEE